MSLKDCTSSRDTNNTGATVRRPKRRSSTDRSLTVSHGGEVKTMLDTFGAEINKSFVAKRKCLESFTSSSLKTSQQKIEALWRSHQRERAQACEDYSTRFSSVFQQWESDMQRNKDQDKKLTSLFQHQQIMFQQMRASQTERLKMLKEIVDHYIKSTQALQDAHEEQNIVAMSELRQETALLHKKILMNTQQEEMVSVRNALQSMLM
ncbi:synaptonemal complex protein 3 isoform X1 [Ictalurus punctatus]|uniref:Synaptonemal complex protein 3 isoform X1 n=1 Tax=Ictalurus punctatus TaxID=7998 RepID=A0A2D0PHM1_ICTPU|nr:synaptonemal complex protein 3 isoform X1 [Ictalurus punctatus]XP_017305895.1 synaptonemal complex protein 3 isoform X1 [Ictalurus punctatus]XP_017305896.1 synaptonemal complex protein 3 isoform X1 [Ictalurus punctatus]XP_017305897.1 synaptonemal complex protein 3 isoform X1 [Ictalurus punctatus]XP_017305898.1 synaptonemal complex protein 3 isoform X1 [Ictalurus punctatus]